MEYITDSYLVCILSPLVPLSGWEYSFEGGPWVPYERNFHLYRRRRWVRVRERDKDSKSVGKVGSELFFSHFLGALMFLVSEGIATSPSFPLCVSPLLPPPPPPQHTFLHTFPFTLHTQPQRKQMKSEAWEYARLPNLTYHSTEHHLDFARRKRWLRKLVATDPSKPLKPAIFHFKGKKEVCVVCGCVWVCI